MESDEWSVSKIKAEGRTVCLFELDGKLDAAGALCNAGYLASLRVVSDPAGGETLERFGSRPPTVVCAVSFIVILSRQELIKMKELVDGGIQPIVSAVFPLAQARHAFQRRFGGHSPASRSSPFSRVRSERVCASRRASAAGSYLEVRV
jgi:hypothetical protein